MLLLLFLLLSLERNQLDHVYSGETYIFLMVAFESLLQGEIHLSYYLELIVMALGPFLDEGPCAALVH